MSQLTDKEIARFKGQPYVRLVRVSDASQKQTSDEAQLTYLKDWADQRQMVLVPGQDYVENNLSGSLPGNRSDLKNLLRDAEAKNNFRYVLVQRVDRATRGGADHLFWLEFELRTRGVRILYPGDELPENVPFEHTLRAAKADAAKETAMSISQRSAQGGQYALEGRRISPHSRTPFGCYRLYCRPDRSPLFVIVDKRDGRQEKRSWPDLGLIDTYGSVGGGTVGHYRKQKSELVYLVLGDPYEVETVRTIFRMRYFERKSCRKIAQWLNANGRPAPRGGKWSPRQVESIYQNEDYTGRAIGNRKSSARYNRRHEGAPLKVELDDRIVTTAARIPPITRPMDEWFEDDEPHLKDSLGDEELRQIAEDAQRKHWQRRMDPTWTRGNSKKRPSGPYLLYPLLKDKDGESLVGSTSGRPGHPVPIYRHKRAVRESLKNSIYGRVFNARALERAVLEVLQETLRAWDELEPRLLQHVRHHIETLGRDDDALAAKRKLVAEVRDQLLLYARSFNKKTQADLAPEIERLQAQRDALDADIKALERRNHGRDLDPVAVVASLKSRLEDLANEVGTLPIYGVADVLAVLTAGLVANMETKEVEFAFHMPSWMALDGSKMGLARLCTGLSSESSIGAHTQRDPSLFVPLASGACQFVRMQRSVCWKCTRRRRDGSAQRILLGGGGVQTN